MSEDDFSLDLDEDEDNKDDDEEAADRERELNGLLMKEFDDLSSVTDDDDQDYSHENSINSNHVSLNGQTNVKTSWPVFTNTLTSTPRIVLENKPGTKFVRRHSILKELEEEDDEANNHDNENKKHGVENGEKISHLESGRFAHTDTLKSKYWDNSDRQNIDQTSYSHVQMLLDENEKLSVELKILQQKFGAVSGDCEGLLHLCKQKDESIEKKDDALIKLEGKLAAIEMQLESETEAKNEFSRKLAVAQSTIESLHFEAKELTKNDSMQRLRDNHESIVGNLKSTYDNEIHLLKEKIEQLKSALQNKEDKINHLNALIKEKDDDISKFEKKRTNLNKELQSKDEQIIRLNDEIIELRKKYNLIESENDTQQFSKDINSSNVKTMQSLKEELELAYENLHSKRNLAASLKSQLSAAKADISTLKSKLEIKDNENEMIKLLEQNKTIIEAEVIKLRAQNLEIKRLLDENEQIKDDLESKLNELSSESSELRESLDEMNTLYAKVCQEKMILENKIDGLTNQLEGTNNGKNNKAMYEEVVKIAFETMKKEYDKNCEKQLQEERKKIEKEKDAEIRSILISWKRDLINQLESITTWVQNLAEKDGLSLTEESNLGISIPELKELRELWFSIENSYRVKVETLNARCEELNKAEKNLREMLDESKIANGQSCPQEALQNLRLELDKVQKKCKSMKKQILEFNKRFAEEKMKHEEEVKSLKNEFSVILRTKEAKRKSYQEEMSLLQRSTTQFLEDVKQGYVSSLKEIKEQLDEFMVESNTKSITKITKTLLSYHDLIIKQIEQKSHVKLKVIPAEKDPNSTTSETISVTSFKDVPKRRDSFVRDILD